MEALPKGTKVIISERQGDFENIGQGIGYNDEMLSWRGVEMTIDYCDGYDEDEEGFFVKYHLKEDNGKWLWTSRVFKSLPIEYVDIYLKCSPIVSILGIQ